MRKNLKNKKWKAKNDNLGNKKKQEQFLKKTSRRKK